MTTYGLERRRLLEDFEGVEKQPPISDWFTNNEVENALCF